MKIIVSNSSKYPDAQVRYLVMFAYQQVVPVAQREGWIDRLEKHPISVRVTKLSYGPFRGRYLGVSYASYIARPFNRPSDVKGLDSVRDILVRIGDNKHFPFKDSYPRFKDMPEELLLDWCEGLVSVTAHELSHTQYSGRRDGEYNCELVSQDAARSFRMQRASFEEFIVRQKRAIQSKEIAMAAKQSPQAVAAKRMADAERALVKWTRKAKLAQTKVKKYTRLVNRLQKRQEGQVQS